MATALFIAVCLATIFALQVLFAHCLDDSFEPITDNVAFKAIYKLEVFVQYNLESITELQEEYQYNLGASRVELRRQQFDETTGDEIIVQNYLYDGLNQLDVCLVGQMEAASLVNRFHLEENGGSSSYIYHDHHANRSRVHVLTSSDSLDDTIFRWNSSRITSSDRNADPKVIHLNLDSFLTSECLQRVKTKLHHVRGLSKLLHLIECRRDAFILDQLPYQGERKKTRGMDKNIYRARNLPALGEFNKANVHCLNMTVSVIEKPDKIHDPSNNKKCLPKRALPTSLSLEFGQVNMIINVFQLETMEASAHLSESGSSESDFSLPVGSGIDSLLACARNKLPWSSQSTPIEKHQFSFRAILSGSRISALEDPVELLVAYDGYTRRLARQLDIVNRNRVVGDSWERLRTRTVFDGEAKIKYHLMDSNDDYVDQIDQTDDAKGSSSSNRLNDSTWTECSSNSLEGDEELALEMGDMDSFDLEGAVYLGMAVVRGITCLVFERRLNRLPFWMGFGVAELSEYSFVKSKQRAQIHSTIYVAAGEIALHIHHESERNPDPATRPKLHRLTITVSPGPGSGSTEPEYKEDSRIYYNLEVYDFDWSIRLASEQMPLFQVGQECLFSKPDARYLQMSLRMEPVEQVFLGGSTSALLLDNLRHDDSQRDASVSRALSLSLGIVHSQQADLETESGQWMDNSLSAKLNVYELKKDKVFAKFLGHAKDLSVGSASTGGWSVGAASITLDECQWRAIHTLQLATDYSASFCRSGEPCRRKFMYCPNTLHCVLADGPQWNELDSMKPVTIESVLQYPVRDPANSIKCSLIEVELTREKPRNVPSNLEYSNNLVAGGLPLNWMLVQRYRLQEALINLEDSAGKLSSVLMKMSQLKLSNIVEAHESNGLSNEPIQGLAYDSGAYSPKSTNPQDQGSLLLVPSVAHCSRACFVHHNCESYSVCHNGDGQFECLLSKVNWSEPVKVAELQGLARSVVGNIGFAATAKAKRVLVKAQLRDSHPVEIKLRRSTLCFMYSSKHLDLFMLMDGSANLLVLSSSNMLASNSSEECAKFCLDRARVLNTLDDDDTSLTTATSTLEESSLAPAAYSKTRANGRQCTSFRYSSQVNLCQLLPKYTLNLTTEKSLDPDSMALLDRWRRSNEAFGPHRPIIKYLVADTYELDYEQMFIVHPDRRLKVSQKATGGGGGQWQESFVNTAFHKCAKLCIERADCKSFDLMSQLTVAEYNRQDLNPLAGSRVQTCILNAFSMADLGNSSHQGDGIFSLEIKISTNSGSDDRWWHYEFNELASYALGKLPPEMGDHSEDIFIRSDWIPQKRWLTEKDHVVATRETGTFRLSQLIFASLTVTLLVLAILFYISAPFRKRTRNVFETMKLRSFSNPQYQ